MRLRRKKKPVSDQELELLSAKLKDRKDAHDKGDVP